MMTEQGIPVIESGGLHIAAIPFQYLPLRAIHMPLATGVAQLQDGLYRFVCYHENLEPARKRQQLWGGMVISADPYDIRLATHPDPCELAEIMGYVYTIDLNFPRAGKIYHAFGGIVTIARGQVMNSLPFQFAKDLPNPFPREFGNSASSVRALNIALQISREHTGMCIVT